MRKILRILTLGLCMMMFGLTVNSVVGSLPSSNVGNVNRVITTDLHYAFENGSYFMYNSTLNGYISMSSSDSPTPIISIGDQWGYGLERVTYNYINNNTTNLTIRSYNNVTNNPSIPFDLSDWSDTYGNNMTLPINNSLSSILSEENYFPEDVYLSDIMHPDTALRQILVSNLLGGMIPLGDVWETINQLESNHNITIYGGIRNSTVVDMVNSYNGTYYSNITADVHINDLTDMDLNNCDLNLTIAFNETGLMTCQHTVSSGFEGIHLIVHVSNSTNQSQYINIDIALKNGRYVIWSSLPECPVGYENPSIISGEISWYWWLLVVGVVTIGATIGIMYMIQRSKCDDIVGVITKGDRKLTKEELAKLPTACHSNKYLK